MNRFAVAPRVRSVLTAFGLFLGAIAVGLGANLAYSQLTAEDCCAPGAPCCYPGSPCCAAHNHVASR